MKTVRMVAVAIGLAVVWTSVTGCVSKDEYLRESFARRKAAERAEALERELADERAKNLALESERASIRSELDAKTALAETLRAENQKLDTLVAGLQQQLDDLMAKGIGDVQVVEVKLPPELDRKLQDFAAQYPDVIEYDAERGAVRWKSDLTFAKGSDDVREDAKGSLRSFAQIVDSPEAAPFEVVIVGHTDNLRIGPVTAKKHPTNWHLSVHRAVSVMFELAKSDIDYGRMGCMGYGEHRPQVPNPSSGGAEANRRVEIFLVARGEPIPSEHASTTAVDAKRFARSE